MTPSDLVRFFAKVRFDTTMGCWLWTGGLAGNGKYACFKADGRTRHAHIVSFNHWRGEVPEGKELDHVVCSIRTCVNPWHVEPRTHHQNVLRSSGPAAVNAVKTHCKHGHPLEGNNLWIQPKTGYRYCRECARRRSKMFYAQSA